MRALLSILIILVYSSQSWSQFYVKGQESSRVRWTQVVNPRYRLIYPEDHDSIAQVFNDYLEYSLRLVTKTLDHTPKQFPVLLHGNSVLSNGFVSWAPKRMEIVSTPPFDASPEPWLFHLALHETRHIVQVDKLSTGFYKYGKYILGEQVIGGAMLFIPLWFLEGDAVFTETIYSKGGRGRQASFYRHYLSHIAANEGSKFSFDKWLLGSFKDYIPSHYNFGYQMVGFTNWQYDSKVWSKALSATAHKPHFIFPFQQAAKKETGNSTKNIFKQMVNFHDSLWKDIKYEYEMGEFKPLIENKLNCYSDYKYPYQSNDSTVVYLKTTLIDVPTIFETNLKTQKQRKLRQPGYLTSQVSYSLNSMYWSEYKAHPRWGYLNYSEVWRYDFSQKKAIKITTKSRYFNPVELSEDSIAVVENNSIGENFITLINRLGEPINSIKIPASLELKEICSGDSNELFARCASPNGMVILRYQTTDFVSDTILDPVFRDISNLNYCDGRLFFTMTHNYREEVFSINVQNGSTFIHTRSSSGYGYINVNNQVITATKYTENGSQPVALNLDSGEPFVIDKWIEPFYSLKEPSSTTSELNQPDSKGFETNTTQYSRFANLFNFHSWAPIYYNSMDIMNGTIELYPGATVVSQNLTSTLISSFGYSYYKTHGAHAQFEWMGLYPKIFAGIDYGNDFGTTILGPLSPNEIAYRAEPAWQARVRIRLPYILSSGNIVSVVNIGLQYYYSNTWVWNHSSNVYQKGLGEIEPYFSFYAVSQMAHRDIRPRKGVQLYAGHFSSPLQKEFFGGSTLVKGWVYLPGFFQNHSMLISAQHENQSTKQYIRNARYSAIRGNKTSLVKSINTIGIDYSLPLVYPDLPIGPVVYIKRIVANVFADYANQNTFISTENGTVIKPQNFTSMGVDLISDLYFLRTSYPFRIGYRGGYRLNSNDFFHEFLMSLELSSMLGFDPANQYMKINR